jgi:hypothetical protein
MVNILSNGYYSREKYKYLLEGKGMTALNERRIECMRIGVVGRFP